MIENNNDNNNKKKKVETTKCSEELYKWLYKN